ncbi:penicillin-binding protein 1A [Oceanospirillum multiglobuliferum]|nr:penicillin-binding protein 1A [Oceanospirillum multiglobuliferum]SKA22559.1 penicillin-binding protein 1A [Oceanospirillum multiglobuliferum]
MRITLNILKWFSYMLLLGVAGAAAVAFSILLYLTPQLPDIEQLKDVQLQTPLRIFTQDNKLIAEFGEKRRTPVTYEQIPSAFIQAILAAEDTSFYSHSGIDIKGLARAFVQLAQTGHIQSGGSTITMQVARNYLLTLDQTFTRKFKEILISLQMEQILSKQEIMELYVNKIYLGNRAYGIDAAAEVYYAKELHELSLAQLAMIAGLPKAPSRYNPIANPRRALLRRNWIIQRMYDLQMIDFSTYDQAVREPISAKYHGLKPEVEAPYVAEMIRAQVGAQLGEEALYTAGYRVYTTIDSKAQEAANSALVNGLLAYDKRHGWRKDQVINVPQVLASTQIEASATVQSVEGELDLGLGQGLGASEGASIGENISNWLKVLRETPSYGRLTPAIVTLAEGQNLQVVLESGDYVDVPWDTITWAKPYHNPYWAGPSLKATSDILKRGDLIYVEKTESGFALSQLPAIQGAFVSMSPENGRMLALVGGFNFYQNKFNRAYQGGRQAGSIFKPFVYTAALENGFTAASIINDAPVVFDDKELESTWRPSNSSGKFYGPTRLRHALYKSRNLVSIRILRAIGVKDAIQFASRFGFNPEQLPKDLSLALGSATLSPFEMASAYAVIANGGFKVEPYFIERIENSAGELLFEATPPVVCRSCDPSVTEVVTDDKVRPVAQRVADERSIYIMHTMLKDVITQGTGQHAKSLGRGDVAGKTGTTNDQKDAWFSGFNQDVVATAWVGFDQPETIAEYGSKAALPIWTDFMSVVLAGKPERSMAQPSGIVTVRIDPETGNRARPGQQNAIFEVFKVENVPQELQSESIEPSSERELIQGGPSAPVQEDVPAAEALF